MHETTPVDWSDRADAMAKPAPPIAIDPATTAFFFDFDGTLAGIVDDPHAVSVEPRILDALQALHLASGGAAAVVSGRSIEQLDRMLHPLRLPAAGVHGLERRDAEGYVSRVEIDPDAFAHLQERIAKFVKEHPGLLAEVKPGSIALHYRKRPELASACRTLAAQLAGENSRLRVLHGKMVVEMKLAGRTKADAIGDFMAEPPFAGRRPLFVGDDVTDEDGFAVLERWDGFSIKIGREDTRAAFRLPDISAFHEWLVALADGRSMAGPSQ
jgi:trehalose 6-phosphate phosphatase